LLGGSPGVDGTAGNQHARHQECPELRPGRSIQNGGDAERQICKTDDQGSSKGPQIRADRMSDEEHQQTESHHGETAEVPTYGDSCDQVRIDLCSNEFLGDRGPSQERMRDRQEDAQRSTENDQPGSHLSRPTDQALSCRPPVSVPDPLGSAPVRIEPVVLGATVQPDVEPGHAEPRGADPERTLADVLLDGCANDLPQGMTLALRRRPQERSEVGIGGSHADWERSYQEGVSTEIGEGHDAVPRLASGELLCEWLRIRMEVAKSGDIDEHELELAIEAGTRHGRGLPAVGLEGSVEQEIRKPIAEARLGSPELDGLAVGEGSAANEDANAKAPRSQRINLGLPHGAVSQIHPRRRDAP